MLGLMRMDAFERVTLRSPSSTVSLPQYRDSPWIRAATGRLKFSHSPGTHDDRLWAFALAVYYTRLEPTEYHPVAAVNKYPRPGNIFPQLPRSLWKT